MFRLRDRLKRLPELETTMIKSCPSTTADNIPVRYLYIIVAHIKSTYIALKTGVKRGRKILEDCYESLTTTTIIDSTSLRTDRSVSLIAALINLTFITFTIVSNEIRERW